MRVVFDGESMSVRMVKRKVRSKWQQFEVAIRPDVALCIPITADGGVLLVEQFRVAVDRVVLEFPAGRLNKGEDAEEACQREVLEEVGFRTTQLRPLGVIFTAPHFSNERVHVFVANGDRVATPTPTAKEDLREVVMKPPHEIAGLIRDGAMLDAKSIGAHSLLCMHGSKVGLSL